VKLLKTEGAMDAARLGKRLGLTPMAVRQHLYDLQRERLVSAEERAVAVGRPAKYWHLTREADRLFPSAYAELSVALIDALGEALGETGVRQVLASRCARQKKEYTPRIPASLPLKEKVQRLAHIRTQEGYMAEMKRERGGGFLLVRIIVRSVQRQPHARGSVLPNSICSRRCSDRVSRSSESNILLPATAAARTVSGTRASKHGSRCRHSRASDRDSTVHGLSTFS